jgi:hypothetical protein
MDTGHKCHTMEHKKGPRDVDNVSWTIGMFFYFTTVITSEVSRLWICCNIYIFQKPNNPCEPLPKPAETRTHWGGYRFVTGRVQVVTVYPRVTCDNHYPCYTLSLSAARTLTGHFDTLCFRLWQENLAILAAIASTSSMTSWSDIVMNDESPPLTKKWLPIIQWSWLSLCQWITQCSIWAMRAGVRWRKRLWVVLKGPVLRTA